MKPLITKILFAVSIFTFAGCVPSNTITSTPGNIINTAIPTAIPTDIPTVSLSGISTATIPPELTTTPANSLPSTYKDEVNGFQLNYPAGWTLVPFEKIGSRGGQAQLYSPGSSAETLADDGTRVYILVYDWEPKNDLTAYVTQRKIAWEASGQKIISESAGTLADGRGEMHFIVEDPEKAQTFSLFTTIGEKYLQIAGDGDLELLEEIARTVRPLD